MHRVVSIFSLLYSTDVRLLSVERQLHDQQRFLHDLIDWLRPVAADNVDEPEEEMALWDGDGRDVNKRRITFGRRLDIPSSGVLGDSGFLAGTRTNLGPIIKAMRYGRRR